MNEIRNKKFRVDKIIFYNKDSKWGALGTSPIDSLGDLEYTLMNEFGSIGMSGNFEGVFEGCEIEVTGNIVNNPKYGKQVQITFLKVIQDLKNKESVINFLAKSVIKGISMQNAKKIYEMFKERAVDVVLNNPDELIKINGIGNKTVQKVKDSVEYYKSIEDLVKFGTEVGLSYYIINKLHEELGDEALNIIKEDPFKILEVSQIISFKQVDEIYLKCNGDPQGKRRLEVGLLYALKQLVMLEGSTGCKMSLLQSKFYNLLGLNEGDDFFKRLLLILEDENKIYIDKDKGLIYYKEYLDIEKNISEKVLSLNTLGIKGDKIKDNIVEEEIKNFPFELNEQQKEAVHKCLNSNVAVLTGSAGCITGDSIISYNRASSGRKDTIEDMYISWKTEYTKEGIRKRGWDKSIITKVRSYIKEQDRVKLNEVQDIVYSGKKEVYLLTLEDGKTLKATPEHKIMTKEGFKELIKLTINDYVMIDTMEKHKRKEVKKETKKTIDKLVTVGKFHPYAVDHSSRNSKYKNFRIEEHRAIYEAHINNITLEEFCYNCKQPNNMKFVDPKKYHIHHIDGDHKNNNINNLVKIERMEHLKLHSKNAYKNFEHGVPEYAKVVSVEYVGIEDTYDICCYKDHNFVANGIVVHNSGKSTISKALYRIYERCGFNVELLSPTAKACRRLEECTGGVAQTIHKFLGMQSDGSIINRGSFENAVFLVDEASMMDIILFNHLLNRMTLTSRILLVGDNNQLPSVQAGNVLGDLIDSNKVTTSQLTEVMRQKDDSNIIRYCNDINKGIVFDPVELKDFHYEEFGTGDELREFLVKKYLEEVGNYGLSEVQVITPYKRGELGMNNLNVILQGVYNKNGKELIEPYRMGDRVRHTQNNYKKDVYNGEVGVIVEETEDEDIIVDYGNKRIIYDSTDIDELTLSYCSTVHASQGSEYKVCFVILDDTATNDFLFIRRLLYTAVSRGKKKVYILTKPYLVDHCIENNSYKPRITKLKEFLEK